MIARQKQSRTIGLALAAAFVAIAIASFFWPNVIADRLRPTSGLQPDTSIDAAVSVVRALALPFLLIGAEILVVNVAAKQNRMVPWSIAIAAALAYLSVQWLFWDWTVDDAAITFAYSENLVRGAGLVLHAGQAHEEGYSSTLWMLILACASWLGFRIDLAAKVLGVVLGALCVLTTMYVCTILENKSHSRMPLLLAAVVCVGAPFIIWSGSGLEHPLQALLFVVIVALPLFNIPLIWPTALCLGALTLLRPETPLVVVAVVATYVIDQASAGRRALIRLWPMIAAPIFVGAALLIFRLYYFGVPYPNPYYAKASTATFVSVFNIFGGSWGYVIDWLSSSGAFLLVPLILLGAPWRPGTTVRLAIGLILAQLLFVLYARGDWMAEFRFLSPILPLVSIVVVAALVNLYDQFSRFHLNFVTGIIIVFLGIGTIAGLHSFRAQPTTPTSTVTAIGEVFVRLAHRLGIEHPILAHHDAGGTSWGANIDVIDLGGLGDRAIARHMNDAAFIRHYLFVERRPTFIFGSARTFAAGYTHLDRMPELAEQYVPLRFPGLPYMKSDLCYIRRDVVREARGVSLDKINGDLVAVVVDSEIAQSVE